MGTLSPSRQVIAGRDRPALAAEVPFDAGLAVAILRRLFL